jgi:uncharacterized protein
MAGHTFFAMNRMHLFFPEAHSLKEKRSELHRAKTILKRLGAAFAEVDYHDAWQRATLAVVVCGDSVARCEELSNVMQRSLENNFPQGFRIERRIVSWNDLEDMA